MKIIAWVTAGLIAGFSVAWVTGIFGVDQDQQSTGLFSETSKAKTDLESRVAILESELANEIQQRQQLQALLDDFVSEQWLGSDQEADDEVPRGNADRNNLRALTPEQRREEFREQAQQRQATQVERRTQRLEEAGFPPEQAEWILRREEEMRLASLNEQWEQRRQQFLESADANQSTNKLREELGEADYERYLKATGRPTSVYVSQLVNNSQATAAGFQAGDEIVRYDGERVYDFNDLNMANVQGQLGEPVLVDIVRDGASIQLIVERGPLGIVGGRRRAYRGP